MFKIINNMAPNDLQLEWYTHKRLGLKVKIPPFNTKVPAYASSLLENSFRVQAAKLWNLIPLEANTQTSLDAFKISLGVFLKKYPDKPPVRGYSTQNNNSIIDWANQSGGLSK